MGSHPHFHNKGKKPQKIMQYQVGTTTNTNHTHLQLKTIDTSNSPKQHQDTTYKEENCKHTFSNKQLAPNLFQRRGLQSALPENWYGGLMPNELDCGLKAELEPKPNKTLELLGMGTDLGEFEEKVIGTWTAGCNCR